MWTRKELKARGKAAFKANYWRCVLVALILVLISGGLSAGNSWRTNSNLHQQQQQQIVTGQINGQTFEISNEEDLNNFLNQIGQDPEVASAIKLAIPIILGVVAAALAVGFVLAILVFNPLMVGCQRFFTENSKSPAQLGEMGYGFKNGYGRVVKTMLLMTVFLILWTLLFIIPGIIKAYSYRMVPYILAQEPELSGREAINRSRQMMNGNKWKSFVLDLSFILWILLSVITLGIVAVFYVNPYIAATNAELYYALRGDSGSAGYAPGSADNQTGVILNGESF